MVNTFTTAFDASQFATLEDYVAFLNTELKDKSAEEIVQWTYQTYGKHAAVSSSFGITSAAMLNLTRRVNKAMPVIWIDTGYLPKETYQFAAYLTKTYDLNVHSYQSSVSPARMEALYGKLHEIDTQEAHEQYGFLRKVEPMQRALKELNVQVLLVGLRADQTSHRKNMNIVNIEKDGRLKICPLLNWSNEKLEQYFADEHLPYHPLKAEGYETVGDAHSSRPVTDKDDDVRASRFNGKATECGLHTGLDMSLDDLKLLDIGQSLEFTEKEQKFVDLAKSEDEILIFTKPTCKYCRAAKELFHEKQMEFKEVDVLSEVTIPELQRIVGKPVKTVPQIYLHGKYIGGYTELAKYLDVPNKFAN